MSPPNGTIKRPDSMFAPNNSVTALIKALVERYSWQREVTPQ